MSHPFGDLVSQHLHRKHGLSQSKLAAGILQAPTVITAMCKGRRLTGPQARERVVAIIGWLLQQGALDTLEEANALLIAAGMAGLNEREATQSTLRGLSAAHGFPREPRRDLGGFADGLKPPRPQRKHNLPAPLTSFIGRKHEIEEIAAQVRTHRLVTLTGAGGIGKTRLALEVARRVVGASDSLAPTPASFDDGVWLVSLAPIADPALVPQVVVAALKLVEQLGHNPLDILASYLEERHALLILDNCEHVIDACAALMDQLLGRCPRLHVLTTSRETLRVPGEITHRVASLALPDSDDGSAAPGAGTMQSAESVLLFVDRARASQPAFDLDATNASAVADICCQLDGIPLAIELAAALLSSMTVGEAAARLANRLSLSANGFRTVASRHQTMRAALDWSYDLLSPDEQDVLARLSVFSGGWMLEQAEAVCGDDVVVETRSIASLLVHKSLVLAEPQGEHTRYRLLEPIRQYAGEKLDETGEADAVRQQHALAYLALAQAAEPHLHAHQQKLWLDRLEREHDNFRAALAWSLSDTGNPDLGLQLAVALWQFWWIRAHLSEGRGWLDALLATASPDASPAARAWALLGAGIMDMDYHGYYGYPATIRQQLEEALKLFRALGDDAGIALSLRQLSVIAGDMNNPTHDSTYAQSLIEESLEVARRQHVHPWITTYVLTQLALSRMWQRVDLARAASLSEECLVLARQYGDARVMAVSLVRLADIAGAQLDFARAAELAREALRVTRESGDTFNEVDALRQLADELRFMGEFDQATALIEEMYGISLEHGLGDWTGWALTMFGLIARDQGNYRRAAARYRESIVWYRDKLKKWGNWWNVLSLGTVASVQGQLQRAAKIYGAIDGWQQSINLLRLSRDQRQFGTYIEATRAELGEAAYATAFEQGRALTPEQAFQYALSHEDE